MPIESTIRIFDVAEINKNRKCHYSSEAKHTYQLIDFQHQLRGYMRDFVKTVGSVHD